MEDLMMGMNDWRNIQDVVRQTFKALHDVVRSQGDKIRLLEAKLGSRATSEELESLQVSMSNKPTFAEVEKSLDRRVEELNLSSIRSQLASKADKADLKELYSDVTEATKKIGEGCNSLEVLVRQQQSEIEALKAQVRKLATAKEYEEELTSKLSTKKWVEDNLAFEADARKQQVTSLRAFIQEKVTSLEKRFDDIPSVSTLDEVFAQKVDMSTLTKVLQDRPTHSQFAKELSDKLSTWAASIQSDTALSIQDATQVAIAACREEVERVEDMMEDKVSRDELLQVCGQKIGGAEFEERLNSSMDTLATEVKEAIVGIQKELVQVLNKKAFKGDVVKLLREKASVEDVQSWLTTKVELVDVRDSLAYKADVSALQDAINRIQVLENHRHKADVRKKRLQRLQRMALRNPGRDSSRKRREASTAMRKNGDTKSRKGYTRGNRDMLDEYFDKGDSDEYEPRSRGRRRDEDGEKQEAYSLDDDDDEGDDDDYTLAELESAFQQDLKLADNRSEGDDCDEDLVDFEEALNWKLQLVVKKLRSLSKQKASIKDVCLLVDQKANIKDVNQALARLGLKDPSGGDMNSRSRPEGLPVSENDPTIVQLRNELATVAEAINSELSTGRWIWSCGRVLSDRSVPWNVECINTNTECFLWSQDSADVTTVVPGLYEIHLGFFAEVDPDVQVLVNGEPIFYTSYQGTQPRSVHRVKGLPPVAVRRTNSSMPAGAVRRTKHSAGNVTGWTLTEFVALPGRARLTVLYDGEMGAQGFFGLRKL